jgi:hypothetical protein
MSRPIGRPQGTRPLRPLVLALALRAATASAEDAPPVVPNPEPEATAPPWWQRGELRVSGLLQPQAEWSGLSEDELNARRRGAQPGPVPGPTRPPPGRQDLRRTPGPALEIDANTVRGPFVSLRRAEASPSSCPTKKAPLPPYVDGRRPASREVPFGAELRQGVRATACSCRAHHGVARLLPRRARRRAARVGRPRARSATPSPCRTACRSTTARTRSPPWCSTTRRPAWAPRRRARAMSPTGMSRRGRRVVRSPAPASTPGTPRPEVRPAVARRQPGRQRHRSTSWWPSRARRRLPSCHLRAVGPQRRPRRSACYTPARLDARSYGEVTVATNLDRSLLCRRSRRCTGYDLRETRLERRRSSRSIGPHRLRRRARRGQYDPNADLFDEPGAACSSPSTSTSHHDLTPVVGLQLQDFGRVVFQYDT